jgi:hypothetical protein
VSSPISEPESLPGRTVHDQLGKKLGSVTGLYAPPGESQPMWVTVEISQGLVASRSVFVPLARLKEEDGALQVPYSTQHLQNAPEVTEGEALSDEDDRRLRGHYGLDRDDQPGKDNPDSYAAQLSDSDETAELIEAGETESAQRDDEDKASGEEQDEGSESEHQEDAELTDDPLVGQEIRGLRNGKVGKIDRLLIRRGGRWAVVNYGLLGHNTVIVPLDFAEERDGHLYVPYEAGHVHAAAHIQLKDGELPDTAIGQLAGHFGLEHRSAPSGISEKEATDLPREPREATPPGMEEGPENPITQRRHERAEELGLPSATGDGEGEEESPSPP